MTILILPLNFHAFTRGTGHLKGPPHQIIRSTVDLPRGGMFEQTLAKESAIQLKNDLERVPQE